MNAKIRHKVILSAGFLITLALFTSCVSTKKYNDLASRFNDETLRLNNKVDQLSTQVNELIFENQRLKTETAKLKADTTKLGSQWRLLNADYQELDRAHDILKKQYTEDFEDSEQILANLKKAQDDLTAREEKLVRLQDELDAKGKQLAELKTVLAKKDSLTTALRKAVADALIGFEGKGLTVHTKNGKVYVSLDEKLLFASGKWDVSADGVSALKKLSKVLEENKDINVLIEGHTDNVPYNGQGQVEDNWDLSVKRATAIVKIILNNGKINPLRLTASGRSEYLPVEPNTTAANKAKNRRTEIILTPKLDELLQIIGEK